MTPGELRASLGLAGIYMLRMMGLFLILPVFSLYARQLPDATPFLIGLAISMYGLTQAVCQIPFGLWSDKVGRKSVISVGLVLFALGSVTAALSHSIYGIILGRAIQGAGAIAAVVMALAADLTREEHRTKAMALIGVSIGISFALSMVAGPVLTGWIGMDGVFWLIAGFALLSLLVLHLLVPTPVHSRFHRDAQANPAQFGVVFVNKELLRLDFGILALHAILMALFVVTPLLLRDALQLESAQHWQVYLPVFVGSLFSLVPLIIVAEKHRRMKPVFLLAILLLAAAAFGLAWLPASLYGVLGCLYLFFTGFNLLEATLPSLVSKIAPAELKGTAMGVYSTAQFLGAFVGGAGGGWLYGQYGITSVYLACAALALLWLLVAAFMRPPRQVSSRLVNLGKINLSQAAAGSLKLKAVAGVEEAVVLAEDGVAYLKVNKDKLDEAALQEVLQDIGKAAAQRYH
ncbi:MAG: MFS transporter [Methylococcaceae bacterium]|nr:MAG: MFS transporter [Methylococcaceae bacterium]